jgi:hypothetical protein
MGGFDYALAEPNLAIAREAIPRLREDLDRFARLTGILPGA